jgi:hypothetical protein
MFIVETEQAWNGAGWLAGAQVPALEPEALSR